MRKLMKSIALCMSAILSSTILFGSPMKVSADQECRPTYEGSNEEAQDYSRWANPIQSYLSYENGRGFMRVQAADSIKGVLVEYYDTTYRYQSSLLVPEELPIFGGFYETDANYYLVTGQENKNESADTEVFRITKYDKSWNRITSTGLYDCNTTIPFRAGSLRFAECGKYLLVRTCHEMYKSSDGLNHQANVTIEVDTENMQITDSYTRVMNSPYGYVSHSFNQFIQVENNKVVSLDHGDAYPRSLVLMKYNTGASINTDVMVFPGKIGDNTTGASVGGFAVAEGYYLVAGNSVPQEDTSNLTRKTRNVFVAAVSKDTNEVNVKWLTDYQEGDGTTSTPQMVQTAEKEYVILWSREGTVFYTKVDNSGTPVGEICQLSGNLSDCVPIVAGNKLVWYTWERETIRFYEIDLVTFGNSSVYTSENNPIQITDASLFMMENTREHILIGVVASASEQTDIEYRWSAKDSSGTTKVIKDWTLNDEWLDWTPDSFGEYTLIAEARAAANPFSSKTVEEVVYFNPNIKGKCQVPYEMVAPGQPGYLIGVETYENPNQSYQYEMLILDCTLLAEGKPAWVYTTGKFTVTEGAAGWCVWQPQYGYYWTLFRVYDAQGNMIDQACYPFVNAY